MGTVLVLGTLEESNSFRGLFHKIVCFEMYLPVDTFRGGRYIYVIFHDVIFSPNPEAYLPVGTFRNELFYVTSPWAMFRAKK